MIQRTFRQRLVRLHSAQGLQWIEEGGLFGSLPWLVEAMKLAQILTGQRIDATGGLVPMDAEEIRELWSSGARSGFP